MLKKLFSHTAILILLTCVFFLVLDVQYGVNFTKRSTLQDQIKLIQLHDLILLGSKKEDVQKILEDINNFNLYQYQESLVINTKYSFYSSVWSLEIGFCKDTVNKVLIREIDNGYKPEKTPLDKVKKCD